MVPATGKFESCASKMRDIMYLIPLLVVESREEVEDAKNLLALCREYVLGCSIELHRKATAKVRAPVYANLGGSDCCAVVAWTTSSFIPERG